MTRESLTVQLPDMKSVADFNETRSNKQEQLYDDTSLPNCPNYIPRPHPGVHLESSTVEGVGNSAQQSRA